jgi:PAS domain-containing protein
VATSFAEASRRASHAADQNKGRLAEELRGGRNLVLNAGGPTNSFLADLEALADSEELSRIQPGSLLDLTGVCALRPDATRTRPESLRVFARSAMDVVVLSGPPWWTRKRRLAALSITLGTLGLALLWVGTLRQQVRRQTAYFRALLEKETVLEQRYRQLFETNPHPMWVYDLRHSFPAVSGRAHRMALAGGISPDDFRDHRHRRTTRFEQTSRLIMV